MIEEQMTIEDILNEEPEMALSMLQRVDGQYYNYTETLERFKDEAGKQDAKLYANNYKRVMGVDITRHEELKEEAQFAVDVMKYMDWDFN